MSDSDETLIIPEASRLRLIPHLKNYASIQPILQKMANKQYTTEQIVQILRKFKSQSSKDCYGQKYQIKKVSFQVLESRYYDILPFLIAEMSKFILRRSAYDVPLLKKGVNYELVLTKETILYLVCMMGLCLIPRQEYHEEKNKNFAYQLDFSYIFSQNAFKTNNVFEYLRKQLKNSSKYSQKVSISRVTTEESIQTIIDKKGDTKICQIKMKGDNQNIQDYFGSLKIDFANAYIGGGALGVGCVQQEIMFSNHPELFITPLICQKMEQNEAIILVGFKKYFCNSGYSYKTQFLGPEFHKYEYDQMKRAKEYISAIDALSFPKNSREQFRQKKINRQLLKSYTGFNVHYADKIVTGNWGCGAFGGDLRLKLLIQWISCSLVGKQFIYCPFGQRKKMLNKELFQKLQKLSVKEAYNVLLQASKICYPKSHQNCLEQVSIYEQLKHILQKK